MPPRVRAGWFPWAWPRSERRRSSAGGRGRPRRLEEIEHLNFSFDFFFQIDFYSSPELVAAPGARPSRQG